MTFAAHIWYLIFTWIKHHSGIHNCAKLPKLHALHKTENMQSIAAWSNWNIQLLNNMSTTQRRRRLITTMYKCILSSTCSRPLYLKITKYICCLLIMLAASENSRYLTASTAAASAILSPAAGVDVHQHRTADRLHDGRIIQQLDCFSDGPVNALVKAVLCHVRVLSRQRCTCHILHDNTVFKWRTHNVVYAEPLSTVNWTTAMNFLTNYSVSTKKRPPPKYNGVVFEILGRHHWNFYNRI